MEIWKFVVGRKCKYNVSHKYQVSNLGRVRKSVSGEVLQTRIGYKGYVRILERSLHHLVLEAFVGPCPTGYQCNHKNGIKDDNRLENLEWVTAQENIRHSWRLGLSKPSMGMLGKKSSAETRRKLSLAGLGRKHTEETKERLSLMFRGRPLSTETRRKISLSLSGRPLSDETRRKISLALRGRPSPKRGRKLPDETRIRMGLAHRGLKPSAETRAKISSVLRGKKRSAEVIAKIRAARAKQVSSPMAGRHHTIETKQKLRLANLGKKLSVEHRYHMSLAQKARHNQNQNSKEVN